uniref:alcohol dehydrogenase (NADP(+)) n=1 Tax=Phallusia mammillata TaxID=59560 RepID=A0A6F9D5K7_9ASCI|nr:aldose reductase-like [Phallusia mammillata]
MSVTLLTLNCGTKMPMLGLGTWQSKPGEVKAAVECAIDVGYRHIDCALAYGNENEVGEGIATKIKENKVKREDLFIVSKLWNVHHDPKDVRVGVQKSLENLKLEYLDLYLIHWPTGYINNGSMFPKDENGQHIASDVDYVDTYKALEKLVDEGLVKSIGVSNFNEFQLGRILKECKVVPANHQVELHPYLLQTNMVEFCQSKGISVTAYSPLGSNERPWATEGEPVLLEDPKLLAIAKRIGKTAAQVLIRFQIQRGVIVIPKSVTPSRIESNFQVFDFELTDEDMNTINLFDQNFRMFALQWEIHKYHPFQKNYKE